MSGRTVALRDGSRHIAGVWRLGIAGYAAADANNDRADWAGGSR
jgi:hypothetical protein